MAALLVVIVLIVVGAVFLLRSDGPPPAPEPTLDPAPLRAALLVSLAEATPAWTWEEVPGEPLQLSGLSSASGERRTLELSDLLRAWSKAKSAGNEEAATRTIDAFTVAVVGATSGEDGGEEADATGAEWALQALGLKLDTAPAADAIVERAGELSFTLVVRQPTGPEPVTDADLAEWATTRETAVQRARTNTDDHVAEGLHTEVVAGDADAPDALRLEPSDPLAASLVLSKGLAAKLAARLGAEPQLWITADGALYATRTAAPPPGIQAAHGPIPPATA